MRKILLLAVLSTAANILHAQTVEFIEPRNVQTYRDAEFSTYQSGDRYYVLHKKYRMMAPVMYDLQLDAYDANRKPTGSQVIDKVLEMGDANLFNGFFPMKNNLVMFKSEFSKASGAKMSYIYAYPFDDRANRTGKKMIVSHPVESASNSVNFQVNVSPDGSKVAIFSEMPFEKDGMEKCMVHVFDEKFKLIWKKEYTFAYESKRGPKNTIFVNNSGTAFVLKQIGIKKEHDQFSVFTFLNEGKNVIEKKIDFGNGFTISSYQVLYSPEGNLQLAGYSYMNKKVGINVETPDGIFFVNVNAANGEFNAAKLNKFSPGTVTATQLIRLPDNTFCLVGERRYVDAKSIPGKGFEYDYNYNYGALYLEKINADGTVAWEYKYERDYKSVNDGGRFNGSYAWVNNGAIQLLFADSWSRHDDKKQFITFGNARVNLIQSIGMDGSFKGETVIMDPRIGGKKGEYLMIPGTAQVYSPGKLFLLSGRGGELVGTTLTY